jgi:hypothetical protein
LGLISSKELFLTTLVNLLQSNVDTIAETNDQKIEPRTETPASGMNKADSEKLVKDHLENQGYRILKLEPVPLADQEVMFKSRLKPKGKKTSFLFEKFIAAPFLISAMIPVLGAVLIEKATSTISRPFICRNFITKNGTKRMPRSSDSGQRIIPLMNPLN